MYLPNYFLPRSNYKNTRGKLFTFIKPRQLDEWNDLQYFRLSSCPLGFLKNIYIFLKDMLRTLHSDKQKLVLKICKKIN